MFMPTGTVGGPATHLLASTRVTKMDLCDDNSTVTVHDNWLSLVDQRRLYDRKWIGCSVFPPECLDKAQVPSNVPSTWRPKPDPEYEDPIDNVLDMRVKLALHPELIESFVGVAVSAQDQSV